MFCPHCGATDQRPTAYCRQCGQWLVDPKKSASGRATQPPEHRIQVMSVFSAVNAALALISAVALYATYLGKDDAHWSVYFAAAVLTVITVHQSISFFFALGLRRQLMRGRKKADEKLDSDLVTGKLVNTTQELRQLSSPPSVVEDTTELLETAPIKDRRLSERG